MAKVVPAKLAYKVFEPASGTDRSLTPLIFFHGLTKSKENWGNIPQIIADKTKRKAYAVDARNHGESEFTELFNFDVNVDDLLHFMDIHSIPKAVLVGHSMGGAASINMALKHPERVEMIIVEDMYTKKIPDPLIGVMQSFLQLTIAAAQSIPRNMSHSEAVTHAVDFMYDKVPHEEPDIFPREILQRVCEDMVQKPDGSYDLRFNKKIASDMKPTLMTEPEGVFDGPAYFLYGDASGLAVWREEEHIKKHFPKAELIKFEGATHEVHVEYPEKFSDTILTILKN